MTGQLKEKISFRTSDPDTLITELSIHCRNITESELRISFGDSLYVSHLSRMTVDDIIYDTSNLRTQHCFL